MASAKGIRAGRAFVELFADDGTVVLTDIFFPQEDFDQIRLFCEGGTVELESGKLYEWKGVW